MNDANAERWRAVVGFEGLYEVSDFGRVRSLDRVVKRGVAECLLRGMILKQVRLPSGYLRCTLSADGRPSYCYVHRMVATTFLGEPDTGFQVCHYDGDCGNNRLSNLRWDSPKNNHADKKRHGTSLAGIPKRTTHCKHGHELTPENIRIIHDPRGDYRQCHRCMLEDKRRWRRNQSIKESVS
jgi:hypothetical protein